MSLELNVIAIQSSDNSIISIKDITGMQSSGNPNGWNGTNPNVSSVTSVTIGGTFRPYPSNSSPINIPTTELMPLPNPLPYVLWQEFILTPSLVSFPMPTFKDGIYTLTYSVTTSQAIYTINSDTDYNVQFSVGDTITDLSTGKILGIVSILTTDSMTLNPATGNLVSIGDTLTNGINNVVVPEASTFSFIPAIVFTYIIQQLITSNSDCCLANNLAKIDPFCSNCGDTRELYCQSFITLMAAKSQVASQQNNSSLDSLFSFNTKLNCNNCGC